MSKNVHDPDGGGEGGQPVNKLEVRLPHRLDVGELANMLLPTLECDDWFVACQHEHLVVLQFSKGGRHQYAVRFECTAPVEKGIFHGSKACWLSITALGAANALSAQTIAAVKASLAHLQ